MQQIRAVPARELDRPSIVCAEEFPEVGKDDFLIHIRILYGQLVRAIVSDEIRQVLVNAVTAEVGTGTYTL